jgi:hypothetical protein
MAKRKIRRRKLTEQEKEQRQQKREIRSLLTNIGFSRIPGIAGKEFVFENRTSEIDDVFHFENVILLIEYTTAKSPGDHLLNKKIVYDKINSTPEEFIKFLKNETKFAKFKEYFNNSSLNKYTFNQLRVKVVYCSKHPISNEHKNQLEKSAFLNIRP